MERTPTWRTRLLAAAALAGAAVLCIGSPVRAHDGLASSTPRAGSTVDQPITEVTIEFVGEISDDFQFTLLDPDENPLPSVATRVSPTAAKITFDPLPRRGTYIVQYLAQVVSDTHLSVGAISFNYGSGGSGMSAATWIFLAVASVAILAVGIGFTIRRQRQLIAESS